ncbi:hypothetical protein F5X97DRAFT_322359 [Nemania serpens]|nr:hypothetical protein F5X97DRAFT_322359 [Nemania serpens]
MTAQRNIVVNIIEQLNNLTTKLSSHDDFLAEMDAVVLARQLSFVANVARVAVQLDLLKHIVNFDRPVTSDELASLSVGEELLITRVLQPMSATGLDTSDSH